MNRKRSIGQRIKSLRKSHKMTQTDLARLIDQSQSSVAMYENGKREPDFETLEAFADIFNVPLSSFVADDDLTLRKGSPVVLSSAEAVIISGGIDKLSPDQRRQALNVLRAMFPDTDDFKR